MTKLNHRFKPVDLSSRRTALASLPRLCPLRLYYKYLARPPGTYLPRPSPSMRPHYQSAQLPNYKATLSLKAAMAQSSVAPQFSLNTRTPRPPRQELVSLLAHQNFTVRSPPNLISPDFPLCPASRGSDKRHHLAGGRSPARPPPALSFPSKMQGARLFSRTYMPSSTGRIRCPGLAAPVRRPEGLVLARERAPVF